MHKTLNRWAVLVSSMGILMCTGAIYAFSIFAGPLSAETGWTMENVMVAFAINAAVGPIPMMLGGFLTDKGWSKWSIMAGGILFGSGFALAGTATSLGQLYFYYGILGGIGQGFAYSGCLNNTMRLFPDKRGLASGLITAGMGGAAIIAAPIANNLIQSMGVSQAFIYMGIAYVAISFICSLFIKAAPKDYVPASMASVKTGSVPPAIENKNWKEMLQSVNFYLILFMLAMGAFSGLMIASNASPIGQSMFGLTAAVAAGYVSLYSLSNTLGRVIWGAVSDKIGRSNTINVMYSVIVITFFILIFVRSTVGFTIGIIGLGLCFGGVMGVFPSLVMENFGPKFQGVNYGIVFIGYSVSAYFAPKIAAGMAASANGDFTKAFYVAISVALGGLALNIFYMFRKRKSMALSQA
ncbi:OFA family MFS transporter [Marinilactibacillus psychrotolerans]|uniref:L-lactate MFS transporter n=1 Tax=Marinilactibacillus psychrotolerans TaxID=191770 RepID=UPI00388A3DED